MKTIMIAAMILGFNITAFSQNTNSEGNDKKAISTKEKGMTPMELDKVVIKAGKNISYYLPDSNADLDTNIKSLENEFIAYNVGNDYEDYERYFVEFRQGKGHLSATYDSNGKLISVVEKYHDIRLPLSISYSVLKTYPGWQIVGDKYTYSQKNGEVTKKEYTVKLKKENETIKLKVSPKGDIIIADVD